MKRKIVLFLYFFMIFYISLTSLKAQNISLNIKNKPLQEVLLELREKHNLQFTYNSKNIENCLISKSKEYHSVEEIIQDLTQICNLTYKKNGSIFILLPAKKNEQKTEVLAKPVFYTFSGKIVDNLSGESLPSGVIRYKNKYVTTDENGNFSFQIIDNQINVTISYLGFYQKDTILKSAKNHTLKLIPASLELQEVIVQTESPVLKMLVGQSAGNIKLNHKITSFLAGNQDNGIYNLLRLQAGIMAAGEQNHDYTIWGSYQGQNLVRFDNINLFSISSFDDNQSVIHPLMIKDIEIKKGGFDAEYSNCVGGIVKITGKNGDYQNLRANFNINNQAVSGYLNIPISERFSLQTSYRQTFYNILDFGVDFASRKRTVKFYSPDYTFRDFNIKLSGNLNDTDNFYVSILASDDGFEYNYSGTDDDSYYAKHSQQRLQYGASVYYDKHFKSGSYANFVLSYSELDYFSENFVIYTDKENDENNHFENSITTDNVSDLTAKATYFLPAKGWNQLSFGSEFRRNSTDYQENSNHQIQRAKNTNADRIGFFVKDEISFGKLKILPSFRVDYPLNIQKFYFQPRIQTMFQMSKNWRWNFAYGTYNQFFTKNTIISDFENYLYTWDISDDKFFPVLTSQHYTTGITFESPIFQFSVEGFYKKIDNILSFEIAPNEQFQPSYGKSKIRGLDFYLKTEFGKHEAWLAYTLSETLENFARFKTTDFQFAPHNQTHELKGATIFNFSPFYLTTNYVYGSGLEFAKREQQVQFSNLPTDYSRLDVAFLYKKRFENVNLDFGFSIINLLNTRNLKYINRINLPTNEMVYSKSMPFTPMLNFRANW